MLTRKEKFTAIENCRVHKRRANFCGDWVGLFVEFQTRRRLFKETEGISIEVKLTLFS